MPDWRKPEDYAYCAHLTVRGWAWEFLRRNEVYSQAWREYEDASSAGPGNAANFAFTMASAPFGLLQPVDPSLLPGDARTLQWADAVHVAVVQDWNFRWAGPTQWPGYPASIALGFDFRLPLGPQIDEAVAILRECERQLEREHLLPGMLTDRPKGRARIDKYAMYIRMLDAKRAGVNVYQIAKKFGKQWWTVKQALGAAEELCVRGYRDLLRMPLRRPVP